MEKKNKEMRFLHGTVLVCASLATLAAQAGEALLSSVDFESGTWPAGWGEVSTAVDPAQRAASVTLLDPLDAAELSGNPSHKVAQFHIEYAWNYGTAKPRAQYILINGPGSQLSEDHTYRFTFDVYIPEDYSADYVENPELFFGIHQRRNAAPGSGNPLVWMIEGDQYYLNLCANRMPGWQWCREFARRPLAELRGRWSTFDLTLKLDQGTKGYVHASVNGVNVASFVGNTNLDCSQYTSDCDKNSPHYPQFCIYKWAYQSQPSLAAQRTLYFDNIRVSELTP